MTDILSIIVVLVIATGPVPVELVNRLASKTTIERVQASLELELIGGKARSVLLAARNGKVRELRDGAARLLSKIDSKALIEPTMLWLNYNNCAMAEVIQKVGEQSGCHLSIYELQKDWLSKRITVREPEPVTFWKAIDSLCQAGNFHYNLGVVDRGPTVAFFRDGISGPSSDDGVFRVQIERIHYNGRFRQLHLGDDDSAQPIGGVGRQDDSFVKLRLMVEPRMMIRNDGPMKEVIAIDERGESLIPADVKPGTVNYDYGIWALARIPLRNTEEPSRMIRQLRGYAPVVVAKRNAVPLVIPLDVAEGHEFQTDETTVTIRSVRIVSTKNKITVGSVNRDGNRGGREQDQLGLQIELTLRPRDTLGCQRSALSVSEAQFELIDERGHVWSPLPWWLSGSRPEHDGEEIRVLLTPVDRRLSGWSGDIVRAILRYYDMTVVKVAIPFEFENLLLP